MISNRIIYIAAVCIATILVYTGCAAGKSPAPLAPAPEPVNNPPIISSLTADRQVVQPLGKVNLNCQASDPESDNLSYQWTASGGLIEGSSDTATWTAPNNPGSYRVTVYVGDGKGGSTTGDALITVPEKPNNAPVISAIKFTRDRGRGLPRHRP
ncbi:MAG: PKD domain-containing protein [Chloroflexi bacterium]|nr:PKD domain-containing protein [Chloroflexota bacterium]